MSVLERLVKPSASRRDDIIGTTQTEIVLVVLFLVVLFAGSGLVRIADLRSSEEQLKIEVEDLASRIENLLVQLTMAESQAAEATSDRDQATQQAEELRERLAELETDLAILRDEATDQRISQQEALDDLRDRLRSALVRLRNLQGDRATEREELSEARAELERLRRLNARFASGSSFFETMRAALEDVDEIEIVGDRFVFNAEILFDTAEAELNVAGRGPLADFARIVRSPRIQAELDAVDWIIRIDGHADTRPISTPDFPSNWELSAARAVSVVKFLIDLGIPEERLAAAGFGEFQPIDEREVPQAWESNRRIEIRFDVRPDPTAGL